MQKGVGGLLFAILLATSVSGAKEKTADLLRQAVTNNLKSNTMKKKFMRVPLSPKRSGLSFLRTKVEVLTGRTVLPDIHKRTGKATVPRPRAVEPTVPARISFHLTHGSGW